jgi:hypothetical protein
MACNATTHIPMMKNFSLCTQNIPTNITSAATVTITDTIRNVWYLFSDFMGRFSFGIGAVQAMKIEEANKIRKETGLLTGSIGNIFTDNKKNIRLLKKHPTFVFMCMPPANDLSGSNMALANKNGRRLPDM